MRPADDEPARPAAPDSAPGGGLRFDWEARYTECNTPWDLGRPHPELALRVADGRLAPSPCGRRRPRALVPGCGRGYDALLLARAGWSVVCLDYVLELEPLFAERFGGLDARLVMGDALDYRDPEPFDLLWDHTFFCAIDPVDHDRYGALARAHLPVGGRFASLMFPTNKPEELGGPPFGMDAAKLQAALGSEFRMVEEGPVTERVTRRRWTERFAAFVRE